MQLRFPRLAATLILCATAALPVRAQQSISDECFKLEDHAKQRECLEGRARKSEQALTDIEAQILSDINSWDQETVYLFQTSSDLSVSTKVFEQYRSAQCELHASLAAGGNSAGDRRLVCEIAMNRKRLDDLKQIDAELIYWKKQ